jgi:hypothetical protein
MGLESANYVLYSRELVAPRLVRIIQNFGGSENSDSRAGTRDFVIHGERHWIDLRWLPQTQTGRPAVFIRVALCNPNEVGQHLKQLFGELFRSGDVVMTDTRSKLQWFEWNDNMWDQLWASFQRQQADFRKTFGNYEAAISADKVFENLRKLPGSKH